MNRVRRATRRRGFSGAPLTRRQVLRGAAAAAVPYFVPGAALGLGGREAPSERITAGVIGLGDRGTAHTNALLGRPDAQLLAVCDVYQSKRERFRQKVDDHYGKAAGAAHKACAAYNDFRELLARGDIDTVFVAAPEYWHSLIGAAACRAGKDVYGEKALTLTVSEGRTLCGVVRRYGRVFQVGTQQRSDRNFRFACELARNGYLGKLLRVKVAVPGGRVLPNAPAKPVPPELDYDLWLGPAPYTPYNDLKCTFNWYFIYDYCVGWIQSWGVHHCDIALWGAPGLTRGQVQVEGSAVFPTDGLADTSVTWQARFTTADGLVMTFCDDKSPGESHGCRFEGSEGWVHVTRGGIRAEPASLLSVALKSGDERLVESRDHVGNFLECVRTRRDPVAPVEAGHAATTVTLVADIATRLGRKLVWDWKAEGFAGDDQANQMLRRAMRSPWAL